MTASVRILPFRRHLDPVTAALSLRARERKLRPIPGARAITPDGTVVQGYASLWGKPDGGGDVVERGAFAASLARLKERGEAVRMLWQHDPGRPIGVWDEIEEDERGLRVRGRILLDVAQGREASALLKAGAIDGLSIGYRTLRASKDAAQRRRLLEVELWEVSLVTFPMLREARASAKISLQPLEKQSDLALLHTLSAAAREARARLRS